MRTFVKEYLPLFAKTRLGNQVACLTVLRGSPLSWILHFSAFPSSIPQANSGSEMSIQNYHWL